MPWRASGEPGRLKAGRQDQAGPDCDHAGITPHPLGSEFLHDARSRRFIFQMPNQPDGQPPPEAGNRAQQPKSHRVRRFFSRLGKFFAGVALDGIKTLLIGLVIFVLSLYVAILGENQGGALLRDAAPQVQLVPDQTFGLPLPGIANGLPLRQEALRDITKRGYVDCNDVGNPAHPEPAPSAFERYQFQAFSCRKEEYPASPPNPLLEQLQNVLFYYDGNFIGFDSGQPSFRPIIKDRTADTIVVEYNLFHWTGPAYGYQATGGTQEVSYRLSDQKDGVVPQSPLPPVADHYPGGGYRDGR